MKKIDVWKMLGKESSLSQSVKAIHVLAGNDNKTGSHIKFQGYC